MARKGKRFDAAHRKQFSGTRRTKKEKRRHQAAEHKYIEGVMRVRSRGTGFVIPERGDPREIEIDPLDLATALHGDRVIVAPTSESRGVRYGEVVRITNRAREEFVGTLEKDGELYFLDPQDFRMYADIVIPRHALGGAKRGYKVIAKITKWTDPKKPPQGEVVSVLGKAGVHETEMKAIVADKGFSIPFPREVAAEARAVKKEYPRTFEKETTRRRDFRSVPTFTIDPETAKDFDDALSIRKTARGTFEVGIHIADVTFFVKKGSALDKEAARRGTSIYLVDRTIPMLPEILSNDLCSLNPEEDKLAFSAVLELAADGAVGKRWFGKTIIRSRKRFTYAEAQKTLEDARESGAERAFSRELSWLDTIAKALRKKRTAGGALDFGDDEVRFILDDDGKPVRIEKKERLETMKLIEDFMVLANAEAAKFATGKDKNIERTFVYRVHDLPDEDKINELARILHALGYKVAIKNRKFGVADIARSLEDIDNEVHRRLVHLATIRAMAKAIYSTKNIGHFGLSLKHYTHFTSPIRRYPDIMVHRILFEYINGRRIAKEEWQGYEALSRYSTQMEIAAQEAEWDSIKYKQAEYMAARIGARYTGTITGFSERGIFVREDTTLAEGMVRLRDLKDDYYVIDEKRTSAVGERTKKKYLLGGAAKIEVARSDPRKRLIDYVFV